MVQSVSNRTNGNNSFHKIQILMQITEKIKITNEDNMEMMSRYPDKYFDLAIVDPPYGIDWMEQVKNPNKGKNWKQYENKDWDSEIPDEEYFKELFRVSKNQIIWGGNYMTEFLKPSPCWIIWDKMQEFSGAVFEMAWTSFISPSKAFRMSRVEAYTSDVKIHPTQKPKKLYKWLFKNYSKPNFKILDTHFGSGSIGIAFDEMVQYWNSQGLDIDVAELVACERDEEYFEDSVQRIKNHVSQLKLF